MWKVEYTKTAREQLKKLPKNISERIIDYMDKRAANSPYRYGKFMKGEFEGCIRYRVGNYRVVCSLHDDVLVIEVVLIGHRGSVYKK